MTMKTMLLLAGIGAVALLLIWVVKQKPAVLTGPFAGPDIDRDTGEYTGGL